MQISGDTLHVEPEITFMPFTTESSGYLNLSETTMTPTVDKIIFQWTNEEIARLILHVIVGSGRYM